jgi:hypothetical protein
MGNVFVDITMSLDGFVTAPDNRAGHGLGDGGECLAGLLLAQEER